VVVAVSRSAQERREEVIRQASLRFRRRSLSRAGRREAALRVAAALRAAELPRQRQR
jgi:hypothetical protein